MTHELPRLKHGSGPAQRLLRAAELDRPGPAARRRALAVAGAVTTLSATSVVTAASGGAAFKGILLWVCVGAVGGGTAALTVSELVAPSAAVSTAARPSGSVPRAPAVSTAVAHEPLTTQAIEAPLLAPSAARAVQTPPSAVAGSKAPSAVVSPGLPAASAGSFGDDSGARPGLFEELRLIEAARASVGRSSPGSALAVLDAYDKAYPGGQFQPEAMALRVQALSQSGNQSAARALLRELERRYPQHPLLARARAAVGDSK
jgi:hypothetical protein